MRGKGIEGLQERLAVLEADRAAGRERTTHLRWWQLDGGDVQWSEDLIPSPEEETRRRCRYCKELISYAVFLGSYDPGVPSNNDIMSHYQHCLAKAHYQQDQQDRIEAMLTRLVEQGNGST